MNTNDLNPVTSPFSSQTSHHTPSSESPTTIHEPNQSLSPSPSSHDQEPSINDESTEINNSFPSSPPMYLPTLTTTIPSEESFPIVPNKESSPNPKLSQSKCNRIHIKNVYGGKSGFHSCQSTINDSFIHALDWNDLTTSITSTDHASFMTVIMRI